MMSNKLYVIGLLTIVGTEVGMNVKTKTPEPVPVAVPNAPKINAMDTVLVMTCPGSSPKIIHYNTPINWSRERDVDGRRIVFYVMGSGLFLAAFPGNHLCVINRPEPTSVPSSDFSGWAP